MIARTIIGIAIAVIAMVEITLPGKALYHNGWFNVAIVTLVVLLLWRASAREIAPAVGVAIVALATIASGLLGPDNQTIFAAPGQQVNLGAAGDLAFPASIETPAVRGRAYRAAFALEPVPHTIVHVEASDARGGGLTITQPTGDAFLSPYLLMRATQTIGEMTLPFDSFAVPALHRQIKAVLFSPDDSAHMPSLAPGWNVLFDVQDDREQQVPGGIGVIADGQRRLLGGVTLEASVAKYPGVIVMSVPDIRFVALGLLIALGGLLVPRILTRPPAA